jgi:hypothetical protein
LTTLTSPKTPDPIIALHLLEMVHLPNVCLLRNRNFCGSLNGPIPLNISALKRNRTWALASHYRVMVTAIQISPQGFCSSALRSVLLASGRSTTERMPPLTVTALPLRAPTPLFTPPGHSMCFVIETLMVWLLGAADGTRHISTTATVQVIYLRN